MALQEMRIDTETGEQYEYDRAEAALQLFRDYEGYALSMSNNGFYIADSGGKDMISNCLTANT